MTRHVAFLGGINLGKRQIKMAELKTAFEDLGFEAVKTLLASGNVIFEAEPAAGLKSRIDKALSERFGFPIEVTTRTDAELKAMVQHEPFKATPEGADVKLYLLLLETPLGSGIRLTGIKDDFDVVRQDAREIYIIAHKLPNGRYGQGMDKLDKQMDKGIFATSRNWNTILKAIA